MKKPQKRATEPKGKWAQYDEFDGIDLSFPWLVICLILLGIGVILCFTSIIVGGVWCTVMIVYLYRLIRDYFRQKKMDSNEVIEEEKPPYHILVAMEQERKEAEARAQEEAAQRAKALAQLEEQKKSGLIGQKEYDRLRKELLQEQ